MSVFVYNCVQEFFWFTAGAFLLATRPFYLQLQKVCQGPRGSHKSTVSGFWFPVNPLVGDGPDPFGCSIFLTTTGERRLISSPSFPMNRWEMFRTEKPGPTNWRGCGLQGFCFSGRKQSNINCLQVHYIPRERQGARGGGPT